MGQNRLNLPNGAESTCLERPGRVQLPAVFTLRKLYVFRPSYGQFNIPAAPSQFTKWGRKYGPGTAWEGRTAGGKSPCGSTFSDHPMDNLTSQLHLLNIEILQILRPLRSAAHEDNPLSSCLSYQAARSYIEMNRLG